MIELDISISRKVYGAGSPVLEDLRVSAQAGEIVAIVGPSGAGKSTLLNIVSGLDTHIEGEVRINGSAGEGQPGEQRPRIGMMFQAPRLMPWLTVLENVRLVLGRGPDALERAREALRDVGLEGWAYSFPGQLSGGMQRRAALARAFAVKPGILLLDEPFVSLDVPTAERLRHTLMELWQAYRPTVLYVTHDLREAIAMSDRVLFLSGSPGRVVFTADIDLPRPRTFGDRAVGELHDALLGAHPDLLSGLITRPGES